MIIINILTDDLLSRDIFPNFIPLRTTSQPQSLRREIECLLEKKAINLKEISIVIFSSGSLATVFLTTLLKSEDKKSKGSKFAGLKTAPGEILGIFLWSQFCDSPLKERGSSLLQMGTVPTVLGSYVGIDIIIPSTLVDGVNPRGIKLGK